MAVGRARALARAGERLAALEYTARGYRILARNWRSATGELDIVAARGGEVVFCEVKTRSSLDVGYPEEAVSYTKQRKIRDLAAQYLASERSAGRICREVYVRFDVASVIVTGDGPPEVDVLEDVF